MGRTGRRRSGQIRQIGRRARNGRTRVEHDEHVKGIKGVKGVKQVKQVKGVEQSKNIIAQWIQILGWKGATDYDELRPLNGSARNDIFYNRFVENNVCAKWNIGP